MSSRKLIVNVIPVMAAVLIVSSCRHEPELPPNGTTTEVCFESKVQPIINANCAVSGCHDGSNGELPVLITYNDIMREVKAGKPGDSKLYEVLTKNQNSEEFMPPSPRTPLTSAQMTLIELWILEGAKNTTCPDEACDSVNVTYSGAIVQVMSNCTGCHGTTSPSAGLSLTTHSQVVAAVNNKNLSDHVNFANGFSPMPPSGIKLSACSLAQLKTWINIGMPNN